MVGDGFCVAEPVAGPHATDERAAAMAVLRAA